MQKQVSQQWTDHPTLRCAFCSCYNFTFLGLQWSFEPSFNVSQHPLFFHVFAQCFEQLAMVDIIKEILDVQVDHPIIFPTVFTNLIERLMSTPFWSITIGLWMKDLFQSFFYLILYNRLSYSIADGRDPQLTDGTVFLWDFNLKDRWREVTTRG